MMGGILDVYGVLSVVDEAGRATFRKRSSQPRKGGLLPVYSRRWLRLAPDWQQISPRRRKAGVRLRSVSVFSRSEAGGGGY